MNFSRIFLAVSFLFMPVSMAQKVNVEVQGKVEPVYTQWRKAMMQKDYAMWKAQTAETRQITIYNRLVSEWLEWPGSVFAIPVAPPTIKGLKAINVNSRGDTAIATYFGKISFGKDHAPTNNLMLLYFLREAGQWKFDKAEYINLAGLPKVRQQMQGGDFSYAAQADFMASGKVPAIPKQIKKRGYLAKLYVYCPGREVVVSLNEGISKHRFQNDKRAEVVIGGAAGGKNQFTFTTKSLPGANGREPLDIRVFLMPRVAGVKPKVVYQYRITPEDINAGKRPLPEARASYNVTVDVLNAIMGK